MKAEDIINISTLGFVIVAACRHFGAIDGIAIVLAFGLFCRSISR